MVTVAGVMEFLEEFARPGLAAEWDNVGLLLGDAGGRVDKIMTCLTVTPETVAEAVAGGAQLVVTHHPILFRAVKRLTTSNPEGRMLLDLIRAGVAVYSPHTAFDNTRGGINDLLAGRLGLTEVGPLRPAAAEVSYKVVVFVPDADLARVSEAMFAAGAGRIGQYRECSFRLAGTGTFFGSEATNPTVGQKGRREEVNEWRLEVICPGDQLEAVLAGMRRDHSYEEPAFDVYPLRPASSAAGEGRLGRLPEPVSLTDVAAKVGKVLKAGLVQFVGNPRKAMVQRVAVVCGAGGEFLRDAIRARADVLLTGEMRFHDYLAARAQGLALVLPGHFATERFGVEELAGKLQAKWPAVETWAAESETDPVQWLTRETEEDGQGG
jgi:dinuclear metal center YbgI/SA1388 family protein